MLLREGTTEAEIFAKGSIGTEGMMQDGQLGQALFNMQMQSFADKMQTGKETRKQRIRHMREREPRFCLPMMPNCSLGREEICKIICTHQYHWKTPVAQNRAQIYTYMSY